MMQFTCNVVIFPWIRGREPFSKVFLQLITCQVISVLPVRDANVENSLTFRLVLVTRKFM
jgi:hypothetical protein